MENIKNKIAGFQPEATFEEGKYVTVTVAPKQLHALAEFLKNDPELQFDYLTSLAGMDWGENLGVVYHLTSSVFHHWVVLKTSTADRENPVLYSVTDLWKAALLNEREVFDFFGIRFINHPDMRKLFLRCDWVGYPFRKDYNSDRALNPVRMDCEEEQDDSYTLCESADGKLTEKPVVLFEKDDYVVNIGPQHPATHGVLRFRTALEGESIKKIDVHCGYIHRGVEKMCESLTYPQMLHLTDRLDYLSAHNNRHALCLCIEEALQLEVPERAQVVRTMMDELMRISSHLLFYATFCMDLAGTTAFFYGFRDREKILDIFDETCGSRMTMNYNTIGGLMADIHPNFSKRVKEFVAYLPNMLKEYHELFTGNVIAQQRMKGVGILTREEAISYGVTGPSGRGSGWHCDVRKIAPYSAYGKVDFKEIVYTEGDVFARYMVRMKEIEQSLYILDQLADMIPDGDYTAKTKAVIKLPAGEYFKQVEANRGALGVYIESRGEKFPYRVKFSSPGLPLVAVVDPLTRGSKIADLIAVGASLDYVVPDIDR